MTNNDVLNIISESYQFKEQKGGPNKVIKNLLLGLDKIGQNYVIDKSIFDYKYNYIHDSVKGLIEVAVYNVPAVVGPNIVVLPKDLPPFLPSLKRSIYLHPSQWCVDVWNNLNYKNSKLNYWPVGIDWEFFDQKKNVTISRKILVYYKRRELELLKKTIQFIKDRGFEPILIKYGSYTENEYKAALEESLFGIWIGVSESQGIGLEEALASNLPLIVFDAQTLFDDITSGAYKFPVLLKEFKPTSVPFFDNSCGIVINEFNELENAWNKMIKQRHFYNPKFFIINNLSLQKQSNQLISFFDQLEYFDLPRRSKIKDIKVKFIYALYLFRRKFKTLLKLLRLI